MAGGLARLILLACMAWLLGLPAARAAQRAFVVGIDVYDKLHATAQLERAVNDARSVAAALKTRGYVVELHVDVTRSQFNAAWTAFAEKLGPDDHVTFYFAGHGIEIEGQNFLLPRDIPNITFGREGLLKRESMSVPELLADLRRHKPRVAVLILDACRDHPLVPPGMRGPDGRGGLAAVNAPEGTFIMYSAGAGEKALDHLPLDDDDPTNSIYTRSLLKLMRLPGLPIAEMARRLREDVHNITTKIPHVQRPAYYDGLIGQYCIGGCDAPAAPAAQPVPPPGPTKAELEARARAEAAEKQRLAMLQKQEADRQKAAAAEAARKKAEEERKAGEERRKAEAAARAKAEAAAIAPGRVFHDCTDGCPEMVVVAAGRFKMGEGSSARDVTIEKAFAVGKFEVTFDEWAACVGGGGCASNKSPSDPGWGKGRRPVINVSWNDAKEYVAWLSRKTGQTYRLLTEAEWEYAARGGTTTRYSWGNDIGKGNANCDGCGSQWDNKQTAPVGSFKANPWGLHDMHGNVWEWCEDADGSSSRVVRGGSWNLNPVNLRSSIRLWMEPGDRNDLLGFRVARVLSPARTLLPP